MKIAIRVDGNSKIGLGHVTRCISLAQSLKKCGNECTFLVADESCCDYLERNAMAYIVLQSKWDDYQDSLDNLKEYLKETQTKMLIVDSYYVDNSFFEEIHSYSKTVYITENIPDKKTSYMDVFINYNKFVLDDYQEKNAADGLILGSRFALLRPEFGKVKTDTNRQKSILILTGGSDPLNLAVLIHDVIIQCEELNNYQINIVSGTMNPHIAELQELEKQSQRVKIYLNPASMSEVMVNNCVAISAAGSTIYELCACMTPTISYIYVDNQKGIAESFSKEETVPYAGDMRLNQKNVLENIISHLLDFDVNPNKWEQKAQRMRELCDGEGADRVAALLNRILLCE